MTNYEPIHTSLEHTDYDPWSDDKRWTKRYSKCWKDTTKRRKQYKKLTNILVLPGYAELYEDEAFVTPFEDIMNRDRKVKVEGDSLYFLDESGWHVGFTVWGLS